MTTTKKEKIKIFISYGHKESKIFKKVVAYLRQKGYEVWFDESSIKGTDDWRQEIVEGIRASQTVIAGLSHDFLKEGGVCSEEMGIALAIKSNRIFTIYLDKKEDLKKIPSTMTRSQYINLSDWKEYIDDDQAFDQWFKKEFQPIIDRIESKDNKEFSGQINTIRHALRIPEIGSNKVNSYLIKKYTKRPWIDEKLEKWRNDPQGEKIGVIYGKQGTGKSHYAAEKCHTDYHVVANFFCEYNKENFSTNKSLIRDLAFQLACQIPDFRSALKNQLESITITNKKINKFGFEELVDDGQIHIREDYSEDEEFDNLILRPFSISIDGKMETHLILIDALDEAGKEERSRLIDIIVNHLDRLPRWIRILILTRPEADIKPYLTDAFEIDLDKESNKKDIKVFLETSFENKSYSNKDEIIDTIVEKSQGTFLYAELVGKEILGGSLSIEDIDKLPKGLARYFSSWFKRIYQIEKIESLYKEKDRKALAMILASPGDLPKEELNNLLGWEFSQTNDFVKKLENYLTINEDVEGKDTIEIAHKYMADWLISDLAGDYRVYKEDGLVYIYKGIAELYNLDKSLDSFTRYEKLNLIDALKNQRGQKALKDFLGNDIAKDKLLDLADEEAEDFRIESASKLYEDMIYLYKDDEENIVYYSQAANSYKMILSELEKESKAIDIFKDVIKILEEVLSRRDVISYKEELAVSCDNLATMYKSMERYEKAELYYKKSMFLIENLNNTRNSLDDKANLANSYNNIGLLYASMQRYEKAELYYKKAIDLRENLNKTRDFLRDKVSLGTYYNGLASIYKSMKKYDESEKCYKKAITFRENIKSACNSLRDISDLASSYGNLGSLYNSIQKYTESEIYYKKSMALYLKIKEYRNSIRDRLNLAVTYNDIGEIYESMQKYAESEIYYKKAIEIYLKLNDSIYSFDNKLFLAVSYNNLGSLYESGQRYYESENYLKKTIELYLELIESRNLQSDKSRLANTYNNIGYLYYSMQRYEYAEIYLQKAIDLQLELKGSRNSSRDISDLLNSYNSLGSLYKVMQRYDEAETNFKNSISLVEVIFENIQPYLDYEIIVNSCYSLSELYSYRNNIGQARKFMHKALKYQKILVEEFNNLDQTAYLSTIYNNLAILYLGSKSKNTEKYFLESLSILEKLHDQSPNYEILDKLVRACENLSDYYKSRGKYSKAELYKKNSEDLLNPNSKGKGDFNILDIKNLKDLL